MYICNVRLKIVCLLMNNETEMMDNQEIKTKRCPKCGRVLPITEFSKNKSRKDGLNHYCKQCDRAKRKEYYQTHRDTVLKSVAEWRAKNPTYNAEYYQANKEKKAAYDAEYYQANKDAIQKQKAEYYQENKDKIADYYDPQTHPMNWAKNMVNKYRSTDRDIGFDDKDTISVDYFINHIANEPCAHCGTQGYGLIGCNRLDNTKGHTIDNVEPCCPSCNFSQNILDQIRRGVHVSCKGKARHKTA